MNIPGADMTVSAATEAILERLKQSYVKAPEFANMAPGDRANWLAALREGAEVIAIAIISDMAAWTDSQGDLGAAMARAIWRYAKEELDYSPSHFDDELELTDHG